MTSRPAGRVMACGSDKHPPSRRHCPSAIASISLRHVTPPPLPKKKKKKAHLGLCADVFPSKVSHLFHTQTLSNWIVNLWWRLIIRPASEVLMRSYFSRITSPQITAGNSRLWVLTCFGAFFFTQFEEELNCHLFIEGMVKVLLPESVFLSLSVGSLTLWHLTAPLSDRH